MVVSLAALHMEPGVAQERTVSEVFTPGDETVWVVEIDAARIGHNWSRYEGEVALAEIRAHHFREQVLVDAEVPGGRLVQRYTVELWTDASGRPLRIAFRAAVSDVKAAVDATFVGGKVEAHVRQGLTDRNQELEIEDGAFVLANNFVSHLDLALALAVPPADEPGSIPFFSVNALRGFPLALEPIEGATAGTGTESADTGKVFRDSLGEVLHLDANGRLERVEVPAQKLEFRRADEAIERFSIELPAPAAEATDLDREEVRIDYGNVSLAGTITRPRGATGTLPAIFLLSGSGGQDRNGVSSGIDLGTREILDRLTREGFLVLRVDDRGVGESTGPTDGLTFDCLVEDARQAVRYLQGRADVDASHISLIGHSEGGVSAPILVAEMDLAALVLMAAPGRSIEELIREQLAYGKELQGAGEEEVAALDRAIVSFFAQIANEDEIDVQDLPPELRVFAGAEAWLRSHAKQDPAANLQRVRAPVLLLQGARDIQASAERDAKRLESALAEVEHPDFELVVFPELDHLFKRTVGEGSSGLDYLKARPVDGAFLDVLATWLGERLSEGRSPG
jgi:hypothetical protein